jgi:hypothetical protein
VGRRHRSRPERAYGGLLPQRKPVRWR